MYSLFLGVVELSYQSLWVVSARKDKARRSGPVESQGVRGDRRLYARGLAFGKLLEYF